MFLFFLLITLIKPQYEVVVWHGLCHQSPGRYVALADCLRNGPDSIAIRSGDVLQLQREDSEGRW